LDLPTKAEEQQLLPTREITNPTLNEICEASLNAGALGEKLLGAGGVDFRLFFVPPGNPANVIEEVVMHPFAFSTTGGPVGVDEPEELDDEALATELMTYAQNSESKHASGILK
jgi:hypothetical protein